MEKELNKITVSFKRNQMDILRRFKDKYLDPTSRIKDLMRWDLECEEHSDNNKSQKNNDMDFKLPFDIDDM